jgi:glycosyltransferase involved in cell wall biosynthesis
MKILVYPHTMELGGSQLNAIQLAKATRDRGHDVAVASRPGPLVAMVKDFGLKHYELAPKRGQPSPGIARSLLRIVRHQRIDLIHAHEWPPILEAYYGAGFIHGTPVVGTVMSMSVASFLPRGLPLTVGTERIKEAAVGAGYRKVTLLEPPIDTNGDHPSVNGGIFRSQLKLRRDEILVVIVCRLVPDLKLEGLLSACDAVGDLAQLGHPMRLAIVGDGAARASVFRRAEEVNERLGRTTVTLAGQLTDPSPAYAAADIIVGQGGSALRGMAFGKPLVVVGEDGFSELLTPETAPTFLRQGWYGLGPGSHGTGVVALKSILTRLVNSAEMRQALGEFGRGLCENRFSLSTSTDLLESLYRHSIECNQRGPHSWKQFGSTTLRLLNAKLARRYRRWTGSAATDDCNSREAIAKVLLGNQIHSAPP